MHVQSHTTLVAASLLAGLVLPLQALINARLGNALGHPYWAAATQNLVGAMGILAVASCQRLAPPTIPASAPYWAWMGGLLGMIYVLTSLAVAPKIGSVALFTAVISGQLISSVVLDHFGILHDRKPIDWDAAAGILLVSTGAYFILRSK